MLKLVVLCACSYVYFSNGLVFHKSLLVKNQKYLPHSPIILHSPRSYSTFLKNTAGDEDYEEMLDDMIYSGDMPGFIRRRTQDIVSEDFLEFLQEKLLTCHEEDEKQVLNEIINLVVDKLRETDGLSDSGIVFESRLDRILFKPPNQRRDYIKENINDMTLGFIEYVQKEMKSMTDIDSKVVLASVLQLIGQEKNEDLLGNSAVILSKADATLGDQFATTQSVLLESGSVSGAKSTSVADRNEQILAGLVFSQNDVLEDVLNNLHEINDEFVTFLQAKVEKCTDIEERVALSSLLQTVTTVLEKVGEVEDEQKDSVDEELDMNQVKKKMQEIQSGQTVKVGGKQDDSKNKVEEFSVKTEKKETFQTILRRFTDLPSNSTLLDVVNANYDLCDFEFMEMLKSEAQACLEEGADIERETYLSILDTINQVMVSRMGSAQQRLERILSKKGVRAMESELISMMRKGEVDEALVLLITANTQQAEAAGAVQAAAVLKQLSQRIITESERKLPDEQRLLRALFRLDSAESRKGLIYQAFKPSKSANQEGGIVEGPPLISPPAFINMVKMFIQNFGNVDGFDLMGKAQLIIDEAQVIATDLYGAGMTARDQQKFMFEKNTVSVWDLANFEEQAMMSGEEVPWRNDKYDTKNPEDVLTERVKRVGGTDADDI
eukprot:gene4842-6787_t